MTDFKVLLYYYYTNIDDPEMYLEEHKLFCSNYDFKGRILISKEGLNGTLSGPTNHCNEYIQYIKSDIRFKNIVFKIDNCNTHLFPKLSIKHRNEIVRLGVDSVNPILNTGTHLTPTEFYDMMNEEDSIILDVRSNYEHNIGKFKNALTFDIDNFRELPDSILNSELFQNKNNLNKNILTYCTGGIKCEKASSLLMDMGFKNVYQLHGGIINYGKKMDGKDFDGSCYVFDSRVTKKVNNVNPEIITNCYLCNSVTDNLLNCKYPKCNRQTTICEECIIIYEGCCSTECKNIMKNEKICIDK